MCARRVVDPELEKLRNEVGGPPNLDTVIKNIERLTCRFHASYLFENEGRPTLQTLCLLLSSTAPGKPYSGWQEFAVHLGLLSEQIRFIDYNCKLPEDPTQCVLLAYVQYETATLDKIIHALQKIKRPDIINRIKDHVCNLIKSISHNVNSIEAGLTIIRPKSVPRVPLVLAPTLSITDKLRENENVPRIITNDALQRSTPTIRNTQPKQKYGRIVMLTFCEDGAATANDITKKFRSMQPQIGVLVLQEQRKHIYSKGEGFIDDCFKQVDYVIPILTKGYIETINGANVAFADPGISMDTTYVRYIYSLLRFEYSQNNCCNNRVRCVVPDNEAYSITRSGLNPTLQAWFKASDIDAFAKNILCRKI